ncbi:MAG: molybdenum cofactor guanylyltransferase [Acidobacteria bacterium]|nr:molybdenum cofactor guanylyltransferase [Acidobacteriota bacterium]
MSVTRFDIDAFILAGGASTRMGVDKALLPIGGQPMLLRMTALLEPLVARVAVVGPPERYAPLGVTVFPDDVPGLGPLGGILTALRHSQSPWFLILGCDLPHLRRDWLQWLIGAGLESEAAVVMPIGPSGYEPLCAMYNQRCAGAIADAVSRNVRKVTAGLLDLTMEVVSPDVWKQFDEDGTLFQNMNQPEDYAAARLKLERGGEK